MEIAPLDLADDDLLARAHAALVASQTHARSWYRPVSLAERVLDWRYDDPGEREVVMAATEGDRVAGLATLWLPLTDNTSLAWFDLAVDPAHRGRGVGSALAEAVLATSREAGRTTIGTEFAVPPGDDDHPYRRFAVRHGFHLSSTELIRHLTLPVDPALLDALDAEARPRWEDRYELRCHLNGVPEELRPSLCAVMNQLVVDAPSGDLDFEPESSTPERYAERLELERAQGRTRLTTVALHGGEVVAYTDLVMPPAVDGTPAEVWQWGTYVAREHRGHRLGTAVKVENLRRLAADHPERDRVATGNEETNRWMVGINERLGFRVVELMPVYSREL